MLFEWKGKRKIYTNQVFMLYNYNKYLRKGGTFDNFMSKKGGPIGWGKI